MCYQAETSDHRLVSLTSPPLPTTITTSTTRFWFYHLMILGYGTMNHDSNPFLKTLLTWSTLMQTTWRQDAQDFMWAISKNVCSCAKYLTAISITPSKNGYLTAINSFTSFFDGRDEGIIRWTIALVAGVPNRMGDIDALTVKMGRFCARHV